MAQNDVLHCKSVLGRLHVMHLRPIECLGKEVVDGSPSVFILTEEQAAHTQPFLPGAFAHLASTTVRHCSLHVCV